MWDWNAYIMIFLMFHRCGIGVHKMSLQFNMPFGCEIGVYTLCFFNESLTII